MIGCDGCARWIRSLDVPGKVIVLICSVCRTEYTLYPNGEIAYNTADPLIWVTRGTN